MPVEFKPFNYQRTMRDWYEARRRDEVCKLAYFASPGLGKTAVSTDIMSERILEGSNRGFLVVAPLRVATITWPEQIDYWRHSSWMKVADMRTPAGAEAWETENADVYLINYEMLATRVNKLRCKDCEGAGCGKCDTRSSCTRCKGTGVLSKKECPHCTKGFFRRTDLGFVDKFIRKRKRLPVDGIVWDELSLCKNPASKRIRAIRPYLHDSITPKGKAFESQFNFHLGLTGTPVANDYRDLFAQIRLLDGGKRFGTAVTPFLDAHFTFNPYSRRYTIKPGSKEFIDQKIADLALVMLGDDYLDVPQAKAEDIIVELPKKARKVYDTLEKELLVELETGEIEALSAAALTTKLLQITGGCAYDSERNTHAIHDAKVDALRKLRKQHAKEPMLVLTAYKHENERLLKAFPEARMFHERDLSLWKAKKIPMWIANPFSLSHGLDGLQVGGRILTWFTLTWSNERYLQTNARLIRTGQSYETLVYRLLARQSIDEAVAESLRWKDEEQNGLLHALKNLQVLAKAA